jgi:hypothetical protein
VGADRATHGCRTKNSVECGRRGLFGSATGAPTQTARHDGEAPPGINQRPVRMRWQLRRRVRERAALQILGAQSGRHVWVANLIVNNRPETMKLRQRSFRTAAGWSFARACSPLGFVWPKCSLGSFRQSAAPLALMLRSVAAEPERRRFHGPSPLRCVSKHEGVPVLILRDARTPRSNSRNFFGMRAPQDEDSRARGSSLNRSLYSVFTMSNSPSRSRDAFLRRNFASPTPNRGVGGAPRDVRVLARHPWGLHMTRQARRLARRLASHDAGRSPLGAPPWRFWALGPRFRLPHYTGAAQRAPRSQVVVPGGRLPAPPGANGYEPPPQDATPRSAFGIVSRTRPQ